MEGKVVSNYQALIFDLDNTLINFLPSEAAGLEAVHARFFASACDLETFKQFYAPINHQLWRDVAQAKYKPEQVATMRFARLAEDFGVATDPVVVSQYYEEQISSKVYWYEGVEQFFRHICKEYPVSIITNGLTVAQQRKIEKMQIDGAVKSVFISQQEGIAKPDSRIFDRAIATLGCTAKDVLMVGDSLVSDFQGALNAGMDFCWVNLTELPLPSNWQKPKYEVRSVVELEAELLHTVGV